MDDDSIKDAHHADAVTGLQQALPSPLRLRTWRHGTSDTTMGMERPPRLPETSMKTMGTRQRIASAAFHQSMMPPSICHVKQRYRRPRARFADFLSRERRFQESKTGLSLMKRERRKNDTIARSRASRSAALGLSEWRRLFLLNSRSWHTHACFGTKMASGGRRLDTRKTATRPS